MIGATIPLSLFLASCATEPAPLAGRVSSSPPVSVPPNATQSLTLSGKEEVPSLDTAALGTGSFEIRPDGSISGNVATTGISATAAHIHLGAAGTNGPVIVTLTRTADNVWSVPPNTTITPAQFAGYLDGQLYVNVHSGAHPSGDIRAQLKPK